MRKPQITSLGWLLAKSVGVALMLFWSLGPVYWSLATSLTPPTDLVSETPHFWPAHPTLDHYARLLGASSVSQGNEVQSVWPQFSRPW